MALLDYVMNNPTINSLLDYAMREPLNALAAVIAVLFIVLFVIHFFACDPDDDSVVHTDYGDIPKDVYEECEAANREKEAAKNKEEEEDLRCGAEYYGLCGVKSEDECDARWQEGKCIYHTDEDVIDKIDRLEKVEQEDLKKNDACFDCDAQNAKQCLTKQEEGTCDYHSVGMATEVTETKEDGEPLNYKITTDMFKRLIEKYANAEIKVDDEIEDVLTRYFFNRRTYECIIDSDNYSINLLTESNPYYTPDNAHIDKDTFSIAGVAVISGGEQTIVIADKNIDINENGSFAFNVYCGQGKNNSEAIIDTVSGNMNFETGILAATTSRYHEDDKKVYSIIILAAVVDHDFSYEEFMGWRKDKTQLKINNINKRIDLARKEFEEKIDRPYLDKCFVDAVERIIEETKNNKNNEKEAKEEVKEEDRPVPNHAVYFLKDPIDPAMAGVPIEDHEDERNCNYEYPLGENVTYVNLLKVVNPDYTPAIAHVNSSDFKIESVVILDEGVQEEVEVDCEIDYAGNFCFDVACGMGTYEMIYDTIRGNINYTTGIFTATSDNYANPDHKVCSLIISGTVSTFEEIPIEEAMKKIKNLSTPKEDPKVIKPVGEIRLSQREIDELVAKMRKPKEMEN